MGRVAPLIFAAVVSLTYTPTGNLNRRLTIRPTGRSAKANFWGGHNTDTFWAPKHTIQYRKVQQLQNPSPATSTT